MAAAAEVIDEPVEGIDEPANTELTDRVNSIIKSNSLYASASGLIPIPTVDIAANTAIQVRMVAQLCDEYNINFSQQAVKSIVTILIASILPRATIGYSLFSLAKSVPVVGSLLGVATMPALNYAVTWAVGRVFSWHFARGGTLENIDTAEMSEKFAEEVENGKQRAASAVRGKK